MSRGRTRVESSPVKSLRAKLALTLPGTAVYALFVLVPIAMSCFFSLHRWRGVGEMRFVGLAQYGRLLFAGEPKSYFWRALGHNLFLVAGSLVVQIPLALFTASMLRRVKSVKAFFRSSVFAPVILPSAVVAHIWGTFLTRGPADELLGIQVDWLGVDLGLLTMLLIISWRHMGFHAVIMLAGFESLPQDVLEAAKVDGASGWQRFLYVELPMMWRVVRISAVLSMLGSLRYFDLVWMMTKGGPARATELLATYMFDTGVVRDQAGFASSVAVVLLMLSLAAAAGAFAIRRKG